MGNEKVKIDLKGKWQMCRRFSINAVAERDLKVFGQQECVIDFAADGIFIELATGSELTGAYYFDPVVKTIHVRTDDSSASAIAGNIYRVIPLNDREMYFMSPSSIEEDSGSFEIILLERI